MPDDDFVVLRERIERNERNALELQRKLNAVEVVAWLGLGLAVGLFFKVWGWL